VSRLYWHHAAGYNLINRFFDRQIIMNNRKKILVNQYEQTTDSALNRVAQKQDSRVFAKVRVADVLPIGNSGLSNEQYSYALKSHFDFIFADNEHQPLFAIEFDEPHHLTDRYVSRTLKQLGKKD
jgi:hypothetical protein